MLPTERATQEGKAVGRKDDSGAGLPECGTISTYPYAGLGLGREMETQTWESPTDLTGEAWDENAKMQRVTVATIPLPAQAQGKFPEGTAG